MLVDEIKQRVTMRDLLDCLGVKVKGHTACCPLHQDTTPSLSFNDKTGLWYCFVCGVGGDVVELVMKLESISFQEALTWLNDKFSLGLTNKKPKRNYYLEALNENYQAFKDSFNLEFNQNCLRYYDLMQTPNYLWTKDDYLFELIYHDKMDLIEKKLRELEDVRFKLRRNAPQAS